MFDSQLTTYKTLDELSARSITWLTLRQRGHKELARLAALPASAWQRHTIDRAGRYRHPHLHEDTITLKGVTAPVRQIAIRNIGRDQPSSVPLNVDLDTTLTVVAGNLYRLFARNLPRYQHATPDTLWRHFLDDTGTLHITPDGVTANLTLRSHHPVLIDAGFADLQLPIPWWDGRPLRFRFPPR